MSEDGGGYFLGLIRNPGSDTELRFSEGKSEEGRGRRSTKKQTGFLHSPRPPHSLLRSTEGLTWTQGCKDLPRARATLPGLPPAPTSPALLTQPFHCFLDTTRGCLVGSQAYKTQTGLLCSQDSSGSPPSELKPRPFPGSAGPPAILAHTLCLAGWR